MNDSPTHSFTQRALALILTIMLAGCAARAPQPLQPGREAFPEPGGFNNFSIEQEIEIGKQASVEADRELPILPAGNEVSRYVRSLGEKLAAQVPEPKYPYTFKVVNQKEINAFAIPGGPVYINLGTITSADNEAELAGVMAHEISHIYMRHSTRQASKQMIAQVPAAILGGILGQGVGGQLARLGLQFGLGSVFMKYSRDAESEADRVGAKIMYEAGYDPQGMVSFFQKLEEEGGSRGPEFLSDHPNPGNRAQNVKVAISQLPPKNFARNSNQFAEAKQAAAKLKPLSAQEIAQRQRERQAKLEQVARQQIVPSDNFRELQHSAFSIAYPENWEAMGNRNSAVTIAPRAGVSENAIAYGVVISGVRPQSGQSLTDVAAQIYDGLRQSNPQIRAADSPRSVTVNGAPAVVVNLIGPSPLAAGDGRPAVERDMLVAVQRPDGLVIWMLFIAPERDFQALSPAFQKMLESLRVS
ncbi:MAG: M48 family metalloprotease [Acidobacteriales bacterium]|nr:M48 family metalloprotease [Terriglobales bacterium]